MLMLMYTLCSFAPVVVHDHKNPAPGSPGTAGSLSGAGSLHAVHLLRRYENLIFSGAARDFVILWLPNGRPRSGARTRF